MKEIYAYFLTFSLWFKMKKIIFISCIVSLLTACSLNIGDLTVASTKKFAMDNQKLIKGKRVTGYDRYPVIMFPLGVPKVGEAISSAIAQDRCAVGLTNVEVTQLNWALMVGMTGIKVEGDLLIDTRLPGCANHI
ncbi:hypothetical protein [Pantoea sp. At-9b]|uniref:hypothetical protein n=1 Tax=Pantoea sp. (strain At-9b) TaxID=592316 RepID=UPI001CBE944E|nr:hypothetical protein [Pantoea sp. At-9b]